jgi:hypothetical protein
VQAKGRELHELTERHTALEERGCVLLERVARLEQDVRVLTDICQEKDSALRRIWAEVAPLPNLTPLNTLPLAWG